MLWNQKTSAFIFAKSIGDWNSMKVIFIEVSVLDGNNNNKNNNNNSSNNNTNGNDNGNNNNNSNWYLIHIDLIFFMYFVDLFARIMYNVKTRFW